MSSENKKRNADPASEEPAAKKPKVPDEDLPVEVVVDRDFQETPVPFGIDEDSNTAHRYWLNDQSRRTQHIISLRKKRVLAAKAKYAEAKHENETFTFIILHPRIGGNELRTFLAPDSTLTEPAKSALYRKTFTHAGEVALDSSMHLWRPVPKLMTMDCKRVSGIIAVEAYFDINHRVFGDPIT
ncbi:MAG: hypothetical protein KGL39_01060 [Patescibacteria group bacterium]|nr:hypothetical protein [Patescibacteria group bacterium]